MRVIDFIFAGGLGALVACSSTQITNTSIDPAVWSTEIDDVLVVAAVRGDEARRKLEEDIVRELRDRGVSAAPSHRYFELQEPLDRDAVQLTTAREGFDAVLVTSYVGTTRDITYRPAVTYYEYISGPFPYPTFLENIEVKMETKLFTTDRGGELLWTAESETLDPGSMEDMSEELAQRVIDRLDDQVAI